MISQAQKIDCRAFVSEKYICFFRNRLFQQNQISFLTPKRLVAMSSCGHFVSSLIAAMTST